MTKKSWLTQNQLKFIDKFIIQECGLILLDLLSGYPEEARPEDRMIALGPQTEYSARYILNRCRALSKYHHLLIDESDGEMLTALVRVAVSPEYVN